MLGGWSVRHGNETLEKFRTRKTAALLAYLAYYANRAHAREELAALFWPDAAPELGLKSLGVALSSLRRMLEPPGVPAGSVIVADRVTIRLRPEAIQTDAGEFETRTRNALKSSDPAAQRRDLETALKLYTGELLPGFYEEWVFPVRERLGQLHLQSLDALIRLIEEAEEPSAAIPYVLQRAQADPDDDEAQARLQTVYAATGRVADAQRRAKRLHSPLLTEESWRKNPASLPPPTEKSPSLESPLRVRLPLQLTRFFGRETEREQITALLGDAACRLLTLTGPGGAGKTRLSIEAARRYGETFTGRIVFTPLADLSQPAQIFPALRNALQLPERPDVAPEAQVAAALRSVPTLLILDNLEHLLPGEGEAEEADSLSETALFLLEQSPDLTLLTTSRRPLGLLGEQEFPVLPLPTPTLPGTPERLLEFASVQLFADRARLQQPDFQVTPRNAEAIVALCVRLEGIPLSLEIAAGQSRALPPAAMLPQLQKGFDALITRQKNVPERHRSLYAAIEWGYRLLSPELQRFFCSLSLFRGGWTEAAAEVVCDTSRAQEYLQELVSRSFVITDTETPTPRYRMLESLRAFGEEKLHGEERRQAQQRHTAWILSLFESEDTAVKGSEARQRLATEEENLRVAIERERKSDLQGDQTLRLLLAANDIAFARMTQEYLHQELLQITLERPLANPRLRARALMLTGGWKYHAGDTETAYTLYEGAGELYRKAGDKSGLARFLLASGGLAATRGREAEAEARFRECGQIAAEIKEPSLSANVLLQQGEMAARRGDFDEERDRFDRALTLFRSTGDNISIAYGCICVAENAIRREDYPAARLMAQECLERARADRHGLVMWALSKLAEVALIENDTETAARLQDEWLALGVVMQGAAWMASGWSERARIALYSGDEETAQAALERSLLLLKAGNPLIQNIGLVAAWLALEREQLTLGAQLVSFSEVDEMYGICRTDFKRLTARAQARLDAAAFDAAWAEGKSLSHDEALRRMRVALESKNRTINRVESAR